MPRHARPRRASTSSVLPRPKTRKSDIRGPRTLVPRHTDSKARLLRSTASTGNLRASANDRKKRRNKLKMDSLANRLSIMDLAPPPESMGSLLDKMSQMQVDPDTNLPEEPTHPDPIPIESHIWLKITFQNPPIAANCPLHSLSVALSEAPTLPTLLHEILRTVAETCQLRPREVPVPDSWCFRVTTGGFTRTFWIGQPSRDVLADGEPIYQAFAAECRALSEEVRMRLEDGVASERFFFGGGRRQASRVVRMVGQEEPVVLARAWASREVSFPETREVVEMEMDDVSMYSWV